MTMEAQNLFSYLGLRQGLTPKVVSIEDLYLDTDNPRLVGEKLWGDTSWDEGTAGRPWHDPRVQCRLMHTIEYQHGCQPLIDSLASLGYVPMDKIVVRERELDKYEVIEGNRRVASMKRLLWDNKRRARHDSAEVLDTFREIEVLVLDSADGNLDKDTFLLQGVRHIAGVRSWGPYQQARMVYACVVEKGLTYKDTAASIGLSPGRASAMLHAYLGVRQMEEHPVFGTKARPELYSHFDQAYKQIPVREWLGWDENTRRYVHTKNLERFYEFITGDEDAGRRPMSAQEVRDVFPGILENDMARAKLLDGGASVAQAASLVPQTVPDPSEVLRDASRAFLVALDDVPKEHLLGRDGRLDMKAVHDVYERLDQMVREYARKKIYKAAV